LLAVINSTLAASQRILQLTPSELLPTLPEFEPSKYELLATRSFAESADPQSNANLAKMEPDLIAEFFVLDHLQSRRHLVDSYLTICWRVSPRSFAEFLGRLVQDFTHHEMLEPLIARPSEELQGDCKLAATRARAMFVSNNIKDLSDAGRSHLCKYLFGELRMLAKHERDEFALFLDVAAINWLLSRRKVDFEEAALYRYGQFCILKDGELHKEALDLVNEELSDILLDLIRTRLDSKDLEGAFRYLDELKTLKGSESDTTSLDSKVFIGLANICLAAMRENSRDDSRRAVSEFCDRADQVHNDAVVFDLCDYLLHMLTTAASCDDLEAYTSLNEQLIPEMTVRGKIRVVSAVEKIRSAIANRGIGSIEAAYSEFQNAKRLYATDEISRRFLAGHILRLVCWHLAHARIADIDVLYGNLIDLTKAGKASRSDLINLVLADLTYLAPYARLEPGENCAIIGDRAMIMSSNGLTRPLMFLEGEIGLEDTLGFASAYYYTRSGLRRESSYPSA
jgi:hypothetical protein